MTQPAPKTKAELQFQKNKLANSYQELLEEFSAKDLRHVGNYTVGRLIGKGSFGKVYLAHHNLINGTKVVLKSSKKDDPNLAREIHHHRQFLHPHIARLYEVIVTENLVWLVLEYCPGDELYNYLLRNGPLPQEKVQKIFTQLVGAVSYIHSMSCVHRDLKLENVLLDKNENVKLCDFGFTREYEGKSNYLQTFCGTICYSAPEMLKGEKYAGEKVDVWSLGIILYALLAGELPFDEDEDIATKKKIMTEEPKFGDKFSEDAKSLINLLLSKRPLRRPTLAEILAHPFLAEHAPQQQVILKLAKPAPFTTVLEKTTLERMKSAGVNIDHVIENVLAQRCDSLAGWWALLIEKEERKEKRRERKRREREAEAKNLRRLSAASSRLERIAAPLVEVDEDKQSPQTDELPRSRGRSHNRRSFPTPQIVVPDLPRLPEGSVVSSPNSATPPPPVEKDFVSRSTSSSRHRPAPPPKERRRSRSSTLQMVTSNPDLLTVPNGITKRRTSRRHAHPLINHLAHLKHWLVDSAKRAKSPTSSTANGDGKADSASKGLVYSTSLALAKLRGNKASSMHSSTKSKSSRSKTASSNASASSPVAPRSRHSAHTPGNRNSTGSLGTALTPTSASYQNIHTPGRTSSQTYPRHPRNLSTNSSRSHRNSLSPVPLTPRSSLRYTGSNGGGLRGRKSTSSSVSSIRSIHHAHSHSKASSTSSKSIDTTFSSPRPISKSPHPSIKVLPTTPSASTTFPSGIRVVRTPPATSAFNEVAPAMGSNGSGGLVFARRKKSAFKGPMIHTGLFAPPREVSGSANASTPGLSAAGFGALSRVLGRKSLIVEEEDEPDEEEIEEVEAFSPDEEKEEGTVFGGVLETAAVKGKEKAATADAEGAAKKDVGENLEVEKFGENNRPSSVVLVNE